MSKHGKEKGNQKKTWLLLDTNYLCHRAYYALGHLRHGGVGTGVIYGVLQDIINLQADFSTRNIIFCFDSRINFRKDILPTYKSSRKKKRENQSEQEKKLWVEFYEQITRLRKKLLKELGFKNVFHQKGMEADDLIASICQRSIPTDERIVIVSSDNDLLQLLLPGISLYSPASKSTTTFNSFVGEHKFHPKHWAKVKAIAGCSGDDVKGIKGVGEKTAAKYLRDELNKTSAAYQNITAGKKLIKVNRKLVRLPFIGTQSFIIRDDKTSPKKWDRVMNKLGIKTMRGIGVRNGKVKQRRSI